MAVLQRQFPGIYERPAAPPVPGIRLPKSKPRRGAYSRVSKRARLRSAALCFVIGSLLILYISGHAAMTAVNYQRVQIISRGRDIRDQNVLLRSEIVRKTKHSAIAAWAKAHGMVQDSSAAVVLNR